MKRSILTVVLILFLSFGLFGQNSNPIDIIVLLNTSSEMSSSYNNVNEYLTGVFLSEYLRLGDTFHLIVFSGSPRLDAARRVSEIGDVETIIGRMLLQYPVENGNNIGAALSFAEQYITTLPSRPKKIVLVSIGVSDTDNLVAASRQRLNSSNTTLDYVRVTPGQALTNLPSSGRGSTATVQPPVTQGPITAAIPPANQEPGRTTTGTVTAPDAAENSSAYSEDSSPIITETTPHETSGQPSGSATTASDTEQKQNVQKSISDSQRSGFSTPVIAAIVVLVLLLLGLIIFFAARKGGSKEKRSSGMRGSAYKKEEEDEAHPFVDHSKDLAQYAAVQSRQRTNPYADRPVKNDTAKTPVISPTGPLLLNLYVEDQNTAIGKRNVHSLKSGYSLSIGGGKSDFLIFLVPMPANIGEIRRNGSQCTFVPKKPKYFPDLGSSELRDCINKTIRIISDKKYEMRIRFEMYEDPLVALNRVLMSIKVPG